MIYITLEESDHRNDLVRKAETQSPVVGMVKQFGCANSDLLSKLSALLQEEGNKCVSRTIQISLLAGM